MSHTPGPWKIQEESFIDYITLDNGTPVAGVYQTPTGACGDHSEQHANANLMAAAPETLEQRNELLAALELLIDAEDRPGRPGSSALVTPAKRKLRFANARAVIAKAKGNP